MSRCFPYPPPGYTLSRAKNEALVDLIKLQKEKERKEKKEKRKEKKEERKEKKGNQESDIQKHLICQNSFSKKKAKESHEKREDETEQLEQSSVTEEHAHPTSLSVPSTSCDSTQNNNNNKRKRHSSSGHGILLRLPSKKQNEFDAASAKEQQPCSTSGRSYSPVEREDADCGPAKGTRKISYGLNFGNIWGEEMCLTSGITEIKPKPEAVLTSMQKMELQYKTLLDCVPTQNQGACLFSDNLDWLFQGRNQKAQAEKKRRFGSKSLSCSRSFSGLLSPRAEYLRDVDIFALPYTVPF